MPSTTTDSATNPSPMDTSSVCEDINSTATPPPALPRRQNPTPPNGDSGTQLIRRRINTWRKKKKPMPKEDVDACVVDMDQYLLSKATLQYCEDKEKKNKFHKCSCLSILRNSSNRWPVAKFCVSFLQRERIDQNQTIIDWYRYSSANPGERGKQWYVLPYDLSDSDEPGEVAKALRHHKICKSAMMTLVQIGKDRMKSIRNIADGTGVATEHGNTGKRKRLKEDDPKLIAVREHFQFLINLAEDCPSAARIIQKMVDGIVQRRTRDNDGDKAVYLPFSMGIRPCYYRYLFELGWSVKVQQDGTFMKTAVEGVEGKEHVALSTYYGIWQRDYDYLKVKRPVEDICALCYGLAHRAKFMGCLGPNTGSGTNNDDDDDDADNNDAPVGINSNIDDQLFREVDLEPEEGEEGAIEPEEGEGGDEEGAVETDDAAVTEQPQPNVNEDEAAQPNGNETEAEDNGPEPNMGLVHMLGTPQPEFDPDVDVEITGKETALNYADDITVIDPDHQSNDILDGTFSGRHINSQITTNNNNDDDEVAPNAEDESREQMLMRAVLHVKRARAQRKEYQRWVKEAQDHARRKVAHKDRTYCGVVDYGQNMELPLYNQQQPGTSYYFSPLSVYNLGFVDHAYEYKDGSITEHMLAHVYHEGIGKKGGNNVCSLVMKSMKELGWIKFDDDGKPITGGHLVLNFDNCTGQNKNNVMMKLIPFLYETKYFSKITFNFLVVGHTKNAADRLFNSLKDQYHKENIFTMDQLDKILSKSDRVTVLQTKESDFFDYATFLDLHYSTLAGKIKNNHIFHCGEGSTVGNQIYMDLRESALDEDHVVKHKAIKRGFVTRTNYANTPAGLQEAVVKRSTDIFIMLKDQLKSIEAPGINVYKKVELYTKYFMSDIVPLECKDDPLYQKPTPEEMIAVKSEKKERKVFRDDINEKKAAKKIKLNAERKALKDDIQAAECT